MKPEVTLYTCFMPRNIPAAIIPDIKASRSNAAEAHP